MAEDGTAADGVAADGVAVGAAAGGVEEVGGGADRLSVSE
jgi:hypothetical protein